MRHFLIAAAMLALALPAFSAESECPQAGTLLDVSKFPGAGPGYPQPRVEAACEDSEFVFKSNGIPHYEFVQVTPGPLTEQEYEFRVPREPRVANETTAIPFLGPAGFAVNGIVFFGPNEGPVPAFERYGDPIYNSIMDECLGHTAMEYHYHAFNQPCLTDGVKEGQRSPVLGYAFDGFPIRGPYGCADEKCEKVIRMQSSWEKTGDPSINAWEAYTYSEKAGAQYLDRCNGHTVAGDDYHYHSTATFPYIIGCYAGTPNLRRPRGGPPGVTQRRGRRPPPGGPGRAPGAGGPPPGARRRGGAGGLDSAASRLGLPLETLAAVIDEGKLRTYLRDPENETFDFERAAMKLKVNEVALRQALEHQGDTAVSHRGHRPGCTVTEEGYLLCHPQVVRGLVDQIQAQGERQ